MPPCLCVCVFLCVLMHDHSKRNPSRNMKCEHIVVYENNSDKFYIENCRIKSRSLQELKKISPFTATQTVRQFNSNLVQDRKLILSMYVHLILIYNIYEYCHA